MSIHMIGHMLCRHCLKTKQIMMNNPALLHALLDHLTEALIVYVCHQIDCGAQVGSPSISPVKPAYRCR